MNHRQLNELPALMAIGAAMLVVLGLIKAFLWLVGPG